ncbi:MAG: tetratricopeptide repeat protein [Bacteroidota bacterium]
MKKIIIWGLNPAEEICRIASNVLLAEIHATKGDYDAAIDLLQKAILLEDKLNYNEPPDWFFSVRHLLGNVFMSSKRYKDAEEIYREDLLNWPKNGFALNGLYESLKAQGRTAESAEVKKQFTDAWTYADSPLKNSRIDKDREKQSDIEDQ